MVVAQIENGETCGMSIKKKNPSLSALESNLAQEVVKPELESREENDRRKEPPKKKKFSYQPIRP